MSDLISDGLDAEQILNSAVFKRAISQVDQAVINSIKATKLDGSPETDRYLVKLYACLQVADLIRAQLKTAMVSGKVEAGKFQQAGRMRPGL